MTTINKTNGPRTIISSGYEIEIKTDSLIDIIQGNSQKTGKPYKMVKQEAWLHTGHGYPTRVYIPLRDINETLAENASYPAGSYLLGDAIDVGGWGDHKEAYVIWNKCIARYNDSEHKKNGNFTI